MIADAIIKAIGFAVTAPLRLLPVGGVFPPEYTEMLSKVLLEVQKWNRLFPIGDIMLVLIAFLTLEAGILSFRGLNWVINKIRGSGG